MICLRCGYCCIEMSIVVPIKLENDFHAMIKPGRQACPHLKESSDGKYECVIHGTPESIGSPCWLYRSDLDLDHKLEPGKVCEVGLKMQDQGGKHPLPINLPLCLQDIGLWIGSRWHKPV